MKHICKKGYIVLSGPFRRFDSATDAADAAKADTLMSGTDHAVIAVELSGCQQEPGPQSSSDIELLRSENAKLRGQFEELMAQLKATAGGKTTKAKKTA